MATVANCESLGIAGKIHLSEAIYKKLKDTNFEDGRTVLAPDLYGEVRKSKMRFEISERNFAMEDQKKRVTMVLGQTYFLVRGMEII